MRPNIVAHKEEGDKRGEAAGDLFGVELFQQSAVGDVGGDDGGQIIATGTPEEVMENPHSYTGYYLKKVLVGNWSKQ